MSSKLIGEKLVIKVGSISGKEGGELFSGNPDHEKEDRLARESLRNVIIFHRVLEEEIQRIIAGEKKGIPLDRELLDKMMTAKEKYVWVMHELREGDDDQGRHALISFADSIQDLMAHIHKQRRH